MTPTIQILIKDATNVIDLKKLRNKLAEKGTAEEYPDNATVTLVSLIKSDGNPVAGIVNVPMAYVDGTFEKKTTYRAVLDDTIALVVGPGYFANVRAAVAGGVRPFKIPCKVMEG